MNRCYALAKAVAALNHAARSFLGRWRHPKPWYGVGVALIGVFALGPQWAGGTAPEIAPPSPNAASIDELADIMVEAPEPRYVSPTRRDQIGRIWAPVMINGHGPFRLVLDTGASHSAVTSLVALALGIPTDQSPPVILRGVTGFATVPTIHVNTLTVGDLSVDSPVLPIVPDALGGAQGILGGEGLGGQTHLHRFSARQDRPSPSRATKGLRANSSTCRSMLCTTLGGRQCVGRRRAHQGHHRYRRPDDHRKSRVSSTHYFDAACS